jgi:ABC-type transport system involved in Fe-S cluster assembly fused permease/ATPase subunit
MPWYFQQRDAFAALLFFNLVCLAAMDVPFSISQWKDPHQSPHMYGVQTLILTVLWVLMIFVLQSRKFSVRFLSPWMFLLGFGLDALVCTFSFSRSGAHGLNRAVAATQALRVITSLALALSSFHLLPKDGSNISQKPNQTEAAARSKDKARLGDEPPDDQKQWLRTVKTCSMAVKYLWPKNNRRIQVCYMVVFLKIIMERILQVLMPQQIGVVIEMLQGNSRVMPWREISLWIFYRWVGSWAGFQTIAELAKRQTQEFARKHIHDLAFTHIMSLSMDFHTNKGTGDVISSIEQAGSINGLLEFILEHIFPVFLDLGVSMCYVQQTFGIYMALIIFPLGALHAWSGLTLNARTEAKRRASGEQAGKESNILYESISNWETVADFNRIPFERKRYLEAVDKSIRSHRAVVFSSITHLGIQSVQRTFCLAAALTLAVWQASIGRVPMSSVIALLLYWETMMTPMYQIADLHRVLSARVIDAERLLLLFQQKPTVTDSKESTDLICAEKSCRVEFKQVNFSYNGLNEVLTDITFTAEPGNTIAFVGETGSGKSTIFKLLFRHYDVTNGSIEINGQDLRSITLSSLRNTLGIVPQNAALFNTTILENVRYACPDSTDEEVEKVCKAAAIHEKIMTFPNGYRTNVGERGIKLSGGELQRLAIARVLLKNPEIVLLDEATSSVDSLTESQIQNTFKALSAGRTTFVIAHRLSTIVEADSILVLHDGEICESGTHSDLLKSRGRYYNMWSKQVLDTTNSS